MPTAAEINAALDTIEALPQNPALSCIHERLLREFAEAYSREQATIAGAALRARWIADRAAPKVMAA